MQYSKGYQSAIPPQSDRARSSIARLVPLICCKALVPFTLVDMHKPITSKQVGVVRRHPALRTCSTDVLQVLWLVSHYTLLDIDLTQADLV